MYIIVEFDKLFNLRNVICPLKIIIVNYMNISVRFNESPTHQRFLNNTVVNVKCWLAKQLSSRYLVLLGGRGGAEVGLFSLWCVLPIFLYLGLQLKLTSWQIITAEKIE